MLTGAASALLYNNLGTTLRYRGLAGVFALAAVVAAIGWLRGLDQQAPLRVHTQRLVLGLASVAALIAAFGIDLWTEYAGLVAIALTTATLAFTNDLDAAARLFSGAAAIGTGVAVIGVAAQGLRNNDIPVFTVNLSLGAAVIGIGAAIVTDRRAMGAAWSMVGGSALLGLGAAVLTADPYIEAATWSVGAGITAIALGAAAIGVGFAVNGEHEALGALSSIGAGVLVIGIGTAIVSANDAMLGAAYAALGVACIAMGAAAKVVGHRTPTFAMSAAVAISAVSAIALTLESGAFGGVAFAIHKAPLKLAVIAVAFGLAMNVLAVFPPDERFRWIRRWLHHLTHAPRKSPDVRP